MKLFNVLVFISLFLSFEVIFAQNKMVHPIKPKDFDGFGYTSEIKELANGAFSKVDTPFVFIARDNKTFSQLESLIDVLPSVSDIDWTKSVVVAAFAGEKSKGGWTVNFKQSQNGKIEIRFNPPGKDMMSASVISTPFKIAVLPVEKEKGIELDLPVEIVSQMDTFKVHKANFEFSGGIAGIKRKFKAQGNLKVSKFGEILTVFFELKGIGKDINRKLFQSVSGVLKNGNLLLNRVDPGSFIDQPCSPFKVNGIYSEKNFSLIFSSLEPTVTDGFIGKGIIEAIQIK